MEGDSKDSRSSSLPLLHITDYFFKEPGWEEFLRQACALSSEKGNTYFVFDRGGVAKLQNAAGSLLN